MIKHTMNPIKHSVAVMLILVTAIFTVACQPTPVKPVVAQKDTVEKAVETLPSQTQGCTPPQTWNEVLTDDATGYTVTIDAAIIYPAYDHFNIYNIRPKNFTQEEVDALVNYFAGGETLYNGEYVQTKQDVEDKIINVKHLMSLSQKDRDDLHGGITEDELQQQLKDLQQQFEKAPETVDKKTVSTALTKDKDGYEVLETYADKGGNDDTLFYVANLAEESSSATFQARIREASKGGCLFPSEGTPEQTAQKILKDLNIEHAQLIRSGPAAASNNPSVRKTVTRYDYELTVDELPLRNICLFTAPDNMEYAAPLMRADTIGIDIGDNGPTNFYWSGHAKITGTVKENVSLMPFETIFETFRQNIFLSTLWPAADMIKEGVTAYPFVITHIDLCMAAVPQKDALGEYLLVPVWNFYGYQDYPDNEIAMMMGQQSERMNVLMTVSAVDGTMLHR